jgi:hypothetical protein
MPAGVPFENTALSGQVVRNFEQCSTLNSRIWLHFLRWRAAAVFAPRPRSAGCRPRCFAASHAMPPTLVPALVQTAEWLGFQRSVEVGGVAQSATRQQRVPWDDAAAPPAQLDIKSLRIGARRVEHQQ